MHARNPALIAACDVPYARRLFRGATRSPVYSAPSLRFSPGCRDKGCVGRGATDQPSSAGSRGAKNCKSDRQRPAIVGEAAEARVGTRKRCHYSGVGSFILLPQRSVDFQVAVVLASCMASPSSVVPQVPYHRARVNVASNACASAFWRL